MLSKVDGINRSGWTRSLEYALQAKGDIEAAEPLYRCALEGLENLLGATHPEMQIVRGNLLRLQEKLARREE